MDIGAQASGSTGTVDSNWADRLATVLLHTTLKFAIHHVDDKPRI
jgi:hypothetical protein